MGRWGRARLAAVGIVVALALTRPWTVLPIATAPVERFDPEAYADSVWSRVLGQAAAAAELSAALQEQGEASHGDQAPPPRMPLFVKGSGVVTGVDLGSRVGLLHLRVEELPAADVALQVGPVLRGTALRDALHFVRFTDFANQSEFAAVANALNDRVLRSVLGDLDPAALAGRSVSFSGAVVLGGRPRAVELEVVPVTFEVAEEAS